MPRRFGFRLALILAVAGHLCAQKVPAKFRVSGKVVNVVNGHALPGTELWFGKAEDFEATQQKLLSGDDGTFAFTVAEPGKYVLNGTANGFRRQGFEQHGMFVSAIAVGAGLNTENMLFRLQPDARVVGLIEDEDHEPIQGATVYLFRTDASFGLKHTSLAAQTISNDSGRYRLPHLEPGRYYLAVSAAPWFSGLLQSADSAGNSSLSEKPEFDVAFPTTFYPGVTDLDSASQIALNEGQDFTADFVLNSVPALRVRVNDINGDPKNPTTPTLQQKVFGTEIQHTWLRQIQVENSTEIRGVPPGNYVLEIESMPSGDPNRRSTRALPLQLTADAEVDPESAPSVVPIHGMVRMEGGVNLQEQVFVRLWNGRADEELDSRTGDKGQIQFDTDTLTPGIYSVYAMTGQNSTMSSLKATGAQVAGQTIQITGGKPVELEIEMSSALSRISGMARRDGKPAAGVMILLVPENPDINLPKFRRDQSDSDGTFELLDVVPGRYRMLAIDDAWDLEWGNASLLKKRLEHAEKIELQPNKTYKITLNVE
jgi:hypothetical protein